MPLISGVVCDPHGEPVAGARVLFTAAPTPLPDIAALTADDGSFRLSAPVRGKYEIAVHADDYAPARVSCEVSAESAKALRVTLHRK